MREWVYMFTHTYISRRQTRHEKKSFMCKKRETDDPRGLFQSYHLSDSMIRNKNINKKFM